MATKLVGRGSDGKREAAPPWTANPVLALERELGRKITTAELVAELERRREASPPTRADGPRFAG